MNDQEMIAKYKGKVRADLDENLRYARVRMPRDLHNRLWAAARGAGRTLNDELVWRLYDSIARYENGQNIKAKPPYQNSKGRAKDQRSIP